MPDRMPDRRTDGRTDRQDTGRHDDSIYRAIAQRYAVKVVKCFTADIAFIFPFVFIFSLFFRLWAVR